MRRLTHSYTARFVVVAGAVAAAVLILGLRSLARLRPGAHSEFLQ